MPIWPAKTSSVFGCKSRPETPNLPIVSTIVSRRAATGWRSIRSLALPVPRSVKEPECSSSIAGLRCTVWLMTEFKWCGGGLGERGPPPPFGHDGDASQNFPTREAGDVERCTSLRRHPVENHRMRCVPHQFRDHVRIKDIDHSKVGGSRTGWRGSSSSSTPPNGANRRWIASARLRSGGRAGVSTPSAMRARASDPIERPFWAARTLIITPPIRAACRCDPPS